MEIPIRVTITKHHNDHEWSAPGLSIPLWNHPEDLSPALHMASILAGGNSGTTAGRGYTGYSWRFMALMQFWYQVIHVRGHVWKCLMWLHVIFCSTTGELMPLNGGFLWWFIFWWICLFRFWVIQCWFDGSSQQVLGNQPGWGYTIFH